MGQRQGKTNDGVGDELLQFVTFKIGEEEFGIDILKVREIKPMMSITKVPKTPDFVEGVLNLRGRILPIIDMRKRLYLSAKAPDKFTRIIIVDIDQMWIGFIVDSVSKVLRIPSRIIEPPPPTVSNIDTEYIIGVGKMDTGLLIILNLSKLLTEEEKNILK